MARVSPVQIFFETAYLVCLSVLRLLQEAQQDRAQLQGRLELLQQEHIALQAGAVALQRDRDYLFKQLCMAQAELDFITGSTDMQSLTALRSWVPSIQEPTTIQNSVETGYGDTGSGSVERSATTRHGLHTRLGQVHVAGGQQSKRAVENLKAALHDHVAGPSNPHANSTVSVGMCHFPHLDLIWRMQTRHAMLLLLRYMQADSS